MVSADESKGLHILLVDDDAELCEMMREFFEQNGHALDCVRNGIDGLERAVEHRYDLVILDVMLPGMNGFMLLSPVATAPGSAGYHADREDRLARSCPGIGGGSRRLPTQAV